MPLVRLLRSLPGVDLVVAFGEQLPEFDLHCPMLSLPLALETTIATIPAAPPICMLMRGRRPLAQATCRDAADAGPRFGLAWSANLAIHPR